MRKTLKLLLALTLLLLLCTGITGLQSLKQSAKAAPTLSAIAGLHVSGNQILNAANQVARPLGVDRSGTEYECVSASASAFDGPSDAASVAAMASWHINAVRVPLNEDCWLGINGFPAGPFSAAQYQQAIIDYVNLLNSYDIIPILDLHWNAPGTQQSKGQQPMADLDHAPAFWTSVANTFKNNTSVIFDLYNEPHMNNWGCWLNGSQSSNQGLCSDINFAVAGMQTLVNAVRATGATNLLMLGGLAYSNDLSMWLQYKPSDPLHNLAASFHLYNFNGCDTITCWNTQVAPVDAQVPVITGEMGENDCQHSFIDTAMSWLDQHSIGYLGWAWDTYDCGGFPALITNYNGTPTQFGLGLKNHLAALAGNPTPTPTPTSIPTPQPTPTQGVTPTPTPQPTPTQIVTPTPIPQPSPTPIPTLPPTSTPTPVPTTGCQITYTVPNQWSNGFIGTITITNHNLLPIIGWTLDFTWPGNQHILGGWNAQFSQQGNQTIVQNTLYNALILPNSSISASFDASYSGSNSTPTQFWLNGIPCAVNGSIVVNPTPTPPVQPTPAYSCAINYTVTNQWINGFVASITIRNTGTTPIQGWHTNFIFSGNQRIIGGWKGTFRQQASSVTINDVGTNAIIAPGHSVTASFTASYSGSNPHPTIFSVNDVPCS